MPTELKYYYANWCGYCRNFKPEWEALKPILDKLKIKYSEYEESSSKNEIEKANIKGYPTIHIVKDNETNVYVGERTAGAILNELGVTPQMGGGLNIDYEKKYLKYKVKYYKLKKELNSN